MTTPNDFFSQGDGNLVNESVKRSIDEEGARFNKKHPARPMTQSMMTEATIMLETFLKAFREGLKTRAPAKYMKQAQTRVQQRRELEQMTGDERTARAHEVGIPRFLEHVRSLYPKGELPDTPATTETPLTTPPQLLDGPSLEFPTGVDDG